MLPPAPALFSTTNCWPNSSDTFAATTRARMSVVPPAANGTTNFTGRVGQSAARARRNGSAASAAPLIRTARRVGRRRVEDFMLNVLQEGEASNRRVGKAAGSRARAIRRRAHHHDCRAGGWWARRKGAFAHPTRSSPHALFLEIFQGAGMERHGGAGLHLVVERETLGFLVHGDDVGLLLHQRLDDGVGVVVAHLVAGDDQVPDLGDGIVLVVAGIRACLDLAR